MNNKTTAEAPLRASETVSVLEQQILGLIKRDGAGQFYNIEQVPEVQQTKMTTSAKKTRKKQK